MLLTSSGSSTALIIKSTRLKSNSLASVIDIDSAGLCGLQVCRAVRLCRLVVLCGCDVRVCSVGVSCKHSVWVYHSSVSWVGAGLVRVCKRDAGQFLRLFCVFCKKKMLAHIRNSTYYYGTIHKGRHLRGRGSPKGDITL